MKDLFLLLLALLTIFESLAQDKVLMDSLSKVMAETTNDSIMGDAAHELGVHIYQFDADSSLDFFHDLRKKIEGRLEASENPDKQRVYYRILCTCYNDLGFIYRERGALSPALRYVQLSLAQAEKTNDTSLVARSYYRLSTVYHDFGKSAQALEVLNTGLNIAEAIDNTHLMGIMLNQLGRLNADQGNEEKALEFYERAFEIHEKNDFRPGMAVQLGNMGSALTTREDYDMALTYLESALAINRELGNWSGETINLYNIASAYQQKKDYNKAWEYFQLGLQIIDAHPNLVGRVYYLTAIGNLFLLKEDFKTAKEYGEEALKLSKQLGYPEQIRNAAKVMRDIYKEEGNEGEALTMYELYIQMRDSVKNESAQRALAKYEYAKQAALDSAKHAQEQRIIEAELATQEAELSQEKTQRYGLMAGLSLMVIFALFIYNRYRLSQRQRHTIAEQKELVDKKNQQVESSIKYAKRIQQSVLPEKSELRRMLPDSFVFYKPRDIVSGDFYWYAEVNGQILIAAVDCTGHGVPGAFMSMIGSTLLNKIVNEDQVVDPGQILSQLHTGVVMALQQEKGEDFSQDGMDMTLCTIDQSAGMVHFAGARNPLYVIQKGKFQEFRTDSKPIGGKKRPKEVEARVFNTQSFPIEAGCSFYLFSDGYTDQFGGENDEKFGKKPFQALFTDNHTKSMEEQHDILDSTFTMWKGQRKQLDDILVIGVRV